MLTPTGRDAAVASKVLRRAGLSATTYATIEALHEAVAEQGAGALLLAEEALKPGVVSRLRQALAQRPPWSNLPIIVLAGSNQDLLERPHVLNTLAPGANITILERPVRRATLVTVLQSALRARERQYDVRNLLARLQAKNDELEQEVATRAQAEAALRESRAALRQINERLEERVAERTQQVRTLSSALTHAEQRERKRIAQVLHDDLQQQLYGLQIWLQALRDETTPAEREDLFHRADTTLDEAIDLTRALSTELSPPLSSGENLDDALRWLALHMEDRYDLSVALNTENAHQLLNEDRRILLFQLVRELLFNVVKHAETDAARIALWEEHNQMLLRVEDEGVGFEPSSLPGPEERTGGFGLLSIRERLRLIGGELRAIDSAPGEGTRITLAVPLEESAPRG